MIFNMKCSIFLVIFMITQIIAFPNDIDQQVKSHESNATGISSTADEKALRNLPPKFIDEKLRFRRQTTGIISSYNFCKEQLKKPFKKNQF